jgi:glutaredoxin
MFGVSWCPHSKAAAKPWKEWSAANDGKSIAGVPIDCETVDCEADDASEAKCQAAGVKGYPTVVAELPSGEKVIMEAKTTVNSLTQFVTKMAQSVASGTSP